MYNIDNELFIREELNGITIYNTITNTYNFYENCSISDFFNKYETLTRKNLYSFLNNYNQNKNIKFKYPFRINWLVSDCCNLNCIYCFADNKLNFTKNNNVDYKKNINNLLNYRPLCVGLTGGEPTLNPNLRNIISELSGRCAIIIDTNGTTRGLNSCIDILRNSKATVRITLDAIDDSIINMVRPNFKNSFQAIDQNIKQLLNNNINVIIHTVVTQKNIEFIPLIYDYLMNKKIVRWQLYPVCYTEKCKTIYDHIKVSDEELKQLEEILANKNKKHIDIKVYRNKFDFSARAVLMLDSKGYYFVDTIFNGIKYCGLDYQKPSIKEIKNSIDIKNHIDDYFN